MAVSSPRARFSRHRAPGAARSVAQTGDRVLKVLCIGAALLAAVVLIDIAYQIISGAQPAFARFGLGFVGHTVWQPNDPFDHFGSGAALYGTAVTSVIALAIGTPLGIAIGLFMALMAGPMTRRIAGPLVEMLAAVPSVIVGFWGVIFLAPFVHSTLEPVLHSTLGFTGLFGAPGTTGLSLFTAGLVLAFMILPIVASLSRDLFLTVPPELRDGAEALGATRWEVIRGVVLPSTASGVAAATMLAFGRALGEAIAVTYVIGSVNQVTKSLLDPGVTLASRIANDITYIESHYHLPSLYYCAVILLVISVLVNLAGQWIGRRFDVRSTLVTT
jgi:phosphate transport system permease protein